MLKSKLLATVIMLGVASTAMAQSKEKDEAKTDPKEKKICRTERSTGSLTRVTRTCLTEAQWDEQARRTSASVDRLNDVAARTDSPN